MQDDKEKSIKKMHWLQGINLGKNTRELGKDYLN